MSWFEFQDIPEEYVDTFSLQPEQGLIFSNIKVVEEFEIVTLDLKDTEDGSTSSTEHIPS